MSGQSKNIVVTAEKPTFIRPLHFGFQKETWLAKAHGKHVLVHRYSKDAIYIPNVSVMKSVRHPNIQRFLFECKDDEGLVILAFSFIEGQSLFEVLKHASSHLAIPLRIKILHDLATGLHYLHKASLLHGDIKPSNVILRNRDLRGIWIDLCALPAKPSNQGAVYFGTPPYIAKEVMDGSYPTEASEVFAFGVLCLAFLSGVLPPAETTLSKGWQRHCLEKIHLPSEVRALLSALDNSLSDDPTKRPPILVVKKTLKKAIKRLQTQK